MGDIEYTIVRRIHSDGYKNADHLAFEFPSKIDGSCGLLIEVNLDGEIYRYSGYNSTDNDQCTYIPLTPKHISDQLHITAPISLDALKAICAAKEVLVAKSFSASGSGGNLRVQKVFDAYGCAWF